MPDSRRTEAEAPTAIVLAYTDTHLCYCPDCARRLGYDNPEKWGPNGLPFIRITRLGEVPEKYCDACGGNLPREE